jgi:hypothetical protein
LLPLVPLSLTSAAIGSNSPEVSLLVVWPLPFVRAPATWPVSQ